MTDEIVVKLTREQQQEILPLHQVGLREANDGKPGMVLAQIFGYEMRVRFVPHDIAVMLSDGKGISSYSFATASELLLVDEVAE